MENVRVDWAVRVRCHVGGAKVFHPPRTSRQD